MKILFICVIECEVVFYFARLNCTQVKAVYLFAASN